MNEATGRYYTFLQWQQEFMSECGATLPVCETIVTCEKFTSLIESFYKKYGFQVWRNVNCSQLFLDFMNDSLDKNWTFAEYAAKYASDCNYFCELDVCSFPNSQLLTVMYNTFRRDILPGISIIDCETAFTSWFNTQLGFTADPYDWRDIVDMYLVFRGRESCVPDIEAICTPPWSCDQLKDVVLLFEATYPGIALQSNCATLFADFFNDQLNTDFSYAEIAALYLDICGDPLTVCYSSASWNCKELMVLIQTFSLPCQPNDNMDACACFTAHFNSHFSTAYTYAQIEALYQQNCGVLLNICPQQTPVFNCGMLQQTLQQFNLQYPGGGAALGGDCQNVFAAFFNNTYATHFSFNYISNLYLVQCSDSLDVCNSLCAQYYDFIDDFETMYGNMQIPLLARQKLATFLFNTRFGYTGSNFNNQPRTFIEMKSILMGCVTLPYLLENTVFTPSLYDPETLRDLKTTYYLLHPDGLPGNCSSDFTSWINWMMGSSLTWCQVKALYGMMLGSGSAEVCGSGDFDDCGSGGGETVFGSIPIPINFGPVLCGLNGEIFDAPPVDTSNCDDPWMIAVTDATVKWQLYLDSLRNHFDTAWYNKCAKAKTLESFTVSFQRAEHHFTLYYYDQAGQLVRTIPPEGVEDKRGDATFLANVKTKRSNVAAGQAESSNILIPAHTLPTNYRYNTLGQVVEQKSPDGGLSKFWYDVLGRLVVSQNAKQATVNKYSYTAYDVLGRITEVGQKPNTTAMTQTISRNTTSLNSWLTSVANKEQITRTVYDLSYFDGDAILSPEKLVQRNLRNRVSYVQVFDAQPAVYLATHRAATYYTYDIHGNVDTLLQDYGDQSVSSNVMNSTGNRYKKIAYAYDLVSGKVNWVYYQPGYVHPVSGEWVNNPDRFYHRYDYDAENRLINVYTSHDSLVWERDAGYQYYRHGPLARTVLGQQQVQGIDYAYTLQGWLKGVNATSINDGTYDIGTDGKTASSNALVARDAYGFSLNYFTTTISSVTQNDYKPISSAVTPFVNNVFGLTNVDAGVVAKSLFNGNIASMMVNIPKLGNANLYGYSYDQLNRIMSMDAFGGLNNSNNTFTASASANYKERITYDANGNIQTYLRNGTTAGGSPQTMDNLTYGYNITSGKLTNNRLRHVDDAVSSGNYTTDIDDQNTDNYGYDEIGNLTKDIAEGINTNGITWSVYGKILSIVKNGNTISYTYDASGNRISKTADGKTTWYVRDASGNVMVVYEKRSDLNSNHVTQTEVHLYGSSRLGIFNLNRDMESPSSGDIVIFERGKKFFELTNHLGNVLVIVSDRKLQTSSGGIMVDCYTSDVISASDNYVFGMTMPGKNYQNDRYHYGFNGKEKDKDISVGDLDFGARIYDGRLGRWLSLDPLQARFPGWSPYNFCYNSPLNVVDPDGKLGIHVTVQYNSATKTYTILSITIDDDLKAVPYSNRAGKIVEYPDIGMNYFNYAEITFVDGNGKVTSSQNKILSFRTNNWAAGKWWAKAKVDDGDYEDNGGVAWTSQDGGNEETRKGRPSHASNIELLMTALSATKSHLDGQFRFTGLEFLEKLTSILEKIPNDNEKSFNPNEDPSIKKDLDALKQMLAGYEENKTPTTTPGNSTPGIEPGKSNLHPAYLKPGGVVYSRRNGLKTEKTKYGRTVTSKPATDTVPEQKGYDAHYPLDKK